MPGFKEPAPGVTLRAAMEVEAQVRVGSFVPRSILVTGGAGFIGSAVVRKLVKSHPEYTVGAYQNWRGITRQRPPSICEPFNHVAGHSA